MTLIMKGGCFIPLIRYEKKYSNIEKGRKPLNKKIKGLGNLIRLRN